MDLSSLEEGRVDNLNGFEVLFLTGVFTAFKEFHFLSLALIVYVRCVNVFVFFFFFCQLVYEHCRGIFPII